MNKMISDNARVLSRAFGFPGPLMIAYEVKKIIIIKVQA